MHTLAITDQVRRAFQKQNRLAAIIGGTLGAFVPLATFTLAHFEATLGTMPGRVAIALAVAGLAYSATTVLQWARIAFKHWPKAIGFVVLLEGSMTLAHSLALAVVALAILTLINALATACNLATDQKEIRKATKAAPSNVTPIRKTVKRATAAKRARAAK